MDDDEEVCRTCLKMPTDEDTFVSINMDASSDTITLKNKLKSCVPEMVLPEEEQASMCPTCVKQLNVAYSFRSMCLKTEETLNKLDSLNYADMIKLKRNKKLNVKNGLKNPSIEILIKDDDFDKSLDALEKANEAKLKLDKQDIVVSMPHIKDCAGNSNGERQQDAAGDFPGSISDCNEVVETIVEVNENNHLDESCIVIDDDDAAIAQGSPDERMELTDDDLIMKACLTIPELNTYRPEMLDCRVSLEYYTEEELLKLFKPDEKPPFNKSNEEDELQVISKVEDHIDMDDVMIDGRKRTRKGPVRKWSRKDLTCKFCGREFTKRNKLLCHVRRTHTKEKPFVCRACGARFYENWILQHHIKRHHDPSHTLGRRPITSTPVFPQQSNVRFPQKVSPMGDYPKGIKSMNYPARLPMVNNTTNRVRLPQKIKIKTEPPEKATIKTEPTSNDVKQIKQRADLPHTSNTHEHKCTICKKVFVNSVHLQKHSLEHKLIRCRDCKDLFNTHATFTAHIKKCMREFVCNTCNRTFTSLQAKNLHVKEHGIKRTPSFFCKECNIAVRNRDHFNIHTGLKPYQCKVCGANFASASAMNGHTQKHSNNRYKKCPHCYKNFIKKTHLEAHIQEHRKELAAKAAAAAAGVKCNVCNKSFKNKAGLSAHTCISVKGEPVYTCQVCKNNFVGRAALIEHVKVHVGKM